MGAASSVSSSGKTASAKYKVRSLLRLTSIVRQRHDEAPDDSAHDQYTDIHALRVLLESGAIRLVKASYLLELSSTGRCLPRRQDLPEHAFCDVPMVNRILEELKGCTGAQERAEMQFPGLVVVSYAWAAKGHPDAAGAMLRHVLAPALEWWLSERAGLIASGGVLSKGRGWEARTWACGRALTAEQVDFGVFVDFVSMHQHPRTDDETKAFRMGLANMDLLYGHQVTVKFRLTRTILADGSIASGDSRGGVLPYGARGWPFFETCASWLISDEWHVIDLGAVDLTQPVRYDLMVWDGFDIVPTGQSRECVFRGVMSAPEALAAQATYEYHGNPGLLGLLKDKRAPPVVPADFAALIQKRVFTNSADVGTVCELQAKITTAVLSRVGVLQFSRLGWGVTEMRALCAALPLCTSLRELSLFRNALGAQGAETLSRVLGDGSLPLLTCISIGANAIGDRGVAALASAFVASPSVLTDLHLGTNDITDVGVQSLVDAIGKHGLSFLTSMSLDRNAVSDVGLSALASVSSCMPHLGKLLMTENDPSRGGLPLGRGMHEMRALARSRPLAFVYSTARSATAESSKAGEPLPPGAMELLLRRVEGSAAHASAVAPSPGAGGGGPPPPGEPSASKSAPGELDTFVIAEGTDEHRAVCALCQLGEARARAVTISRIDHPTLAARFHGHLPAHAETAEETGVSFQLHGTDAERVRSIFREGFRLPTEQDASGDFQAGANARRQAGYERLMFGSAVYLCSSSAKALTFSPDGTLLVCAVKLGKRLEADTKWVDYTLTRETMAAKGFDSVERAPSGQEQQEQQEVAVYHPEAVLPLYSVEGVGPWASTAAAATEVKLVA